MLMRYVDNTFTNNFFNTIGVDFKMKSIYLDKKALRLQIWDTAGQERFQTITCNYYHGAQGIFVVYDITDRESFNSVKMWMGEIKKYAQPNVIKILVGNKNDMEEKREISFEEGKEMADSYNIDFFETSAKETYQIDKSFNEISKLIVDKMNKAPQVIEDENLHISGVNNKRKSENKGCC